MEAKVVEKRNGVVRVEVKLHKEELAGKEQETLNLFRKHKIVPGFRKGKSPHQLVLNRFRKEIKDYVVSSVLPEKIKKYIEDEKFDVLGQPWFNKIDYNFGDSLNAEIQFEVVPDFELPDYKNIEIEIPKYEVKEEDIQKSVESLQDKYAQFKSSPDKEISENDFAIVDYSINCNGKEVEKREGAWLKISKDAYLKELVDAIKGLKVGDEKEVKVTLPNNYYQDEYAGKKVVVKVKVIDVKEKVKPELNDDFAKMASSGKYSSVDELREWAKEELEKAFRKRKEREIRERIYKYLLDNTKVEVPPYALREEVDKEMKKEAANYSLMGYSVGQIKDFVSKNFANIEERAKNGLILDFVFKKIAEKENIEVSEEDIDKKIKELAQNPSYKTSEEELRKYYYQNENKEQKQKLVELIRLEKVLDFIVNHANIKEIEIENNGEERK